MTQIAYIHGLSGDQPGKAFKKVPAQRGIDYKRMSEGELRLSLIAEQLNILGKYYNKPQYIEAQNRIIDTLYKGLHVNTPFIGASAGAAMAMVSREIKKARKMTQPAGKILYRNLSKGINDPLIPLEDCDSIWNDPKWEGMPVWEKAKKAAPLMKECAAQNEEAKIINTKLESSSHHLLYEYLIPSGAPAVVAAKSVSHRNAVSTLASVTSLSRDNLRLWIRNGIMRKNAEAGADPFQPEKTIEILANEIPDKENISGPFILALPKIILAIGSAIAATATLISALDASKRNQIYATASGIGTSTFGPEESDWVAGQSAATPGGSDQNLLPLALAAGAFFLIKQ
jgi:hypothetical protein